MKRQPPVADPAVGPLDIPLRELPRSMRRLVVATHVATALGWIGAISLVGLPSVGHLFTRPEFWIAAVLIEFADLYPLVPWMRDVRGRVRLHWSGTFALALVLVCGPATVVVFPLMTMAAQSTMRGFAWRRLFNASVVTLEALAGFAAMYLLYGSWPEHPSAMQLLIAGAVIGIVWDVVNLVMIGTAMTLFDGTPIGQTIVFGIRRTAPWLAALAASPTIAYVIMEAPALSVGILLLAVLVHHSIASNIRRSDEARTDQLTGLANRVSALEYLDRLLLARRLVGDTLLMMIDLNGFKAVNDTYGHDVGDGVLVDVAQRIRSVVPAHLLVARLGGDEFLVVGDTAQPGADADDADAAIARAIEDAIRVPFTVPSGDTISLTCSVGSVRADQGAHSMDILRAADQRMYQSKQAQ